MVKSVQESLAWIAQRRSVFPAEFEDGRATQTELNQLLEAARWAPTHKVTEPWRFKVFMGESRSELVEAQHRGIVAVEIDEGVRMKKAEKLRYLADRSSAVIAIVMQRDKQGRVPVSEELWSVACAVQNMYLHMASLGLGGYWSTGGACNCQQVRAFLKLAPDDVQMGWFYVGKFSGNKRLSRERLKVEDYTEWFV